MVQASDITVAQVIDFVNEHGRCVKANYKVGGRTHTEKSLLDTYAGALANRINSGAEA